MTLRTISDRFFARDLEREARAHGQTELAEVLRRYGRNRLISIIGLAFTLVLIGFSVAQLVFNYGHPMPWWLLVIFLAVFVGAMVYSWWVGPRAGQP
jgi:membrane protein YdbS with pleckstrin-like domain